MLKPSAILLAGLVCLFSTSTRAQAGNWKTGWLHSPNNMAVETDWSPIVLPRGAYREKLKAMPIETRPGRLLHVYGNAVRYRLQAEAGFGGNPVRRIVIGK